MSLAFNTGDPEGGVIIHASILGKTVEVLLSDWESLEAGCGRKLTRQEVIELLKAHRPLAEQIMIEAIRMGVAYTPGNVSLPGITSRVGPLSP